MDWHSKRMLTWHQSNTANHHFRIAALEWALRRHGKPERFKTKQRAMFTTPDFTGVLTDAEIRRYIGEYIRKYNEERPHSGIGCRTPQEVNSKIRTRVAA
ncbi:MAG: integrase core domain-containing protein [Spirochaetaceae bacterium]